MVRLGANAKSVEKALPTMAATISHVAVLLVIGMFHLTNIEF